MLSAMVKPDAALALPAPAADDGLARADAFLAEQFRRSSSLATLDTEALLRWWRADGQPGEALADFLTGAGILSPGAARTIEMVQKGYVQLPDVMQLLRPGALEQLQARLPAVTAARPLPAASPASLSNNPTVVAAAESASAGREAPPVLEIGSTLGKCLLTELLGQGGCGMVFRALHRGLNIPVAVKVIQKQLLGSDPLVYQRLRGEARMLAQLNHPHIVRVLDFEEDAHLPYVVMELVEGLSLAELIEQSGCLRLYKAVRTIAQVAQGLAAAQRFGIVHRDVKPANILLARDGTAKLADLGLAVAAGGRSLAQCLGVGEAHGELAGTVAYMAPEQFAAPAAVDHRSDIYALG
ncbi:MAG: serine/threonine protein kinase, partial [Planctomycetia bacterium]|nr:serine/threonine protein kinase [Planctomycetia bacterium]